ncbi:MAG: hypothetical protein AABZ44_05835, partial [Elusimicrobiota bacterium]
MKKARLQTPGLQAPLAVLARHRTPWWIDPFGRAIEIKGQDHALSAIAMLKERGIVAGPEAAIAALVDEGWIRVQVYPNRTAFIQGSVGFLTDNGDAIMSIVPKLRCVEIACVPAGRYRQAPVISKAQIN